MLLVKIARKNTGRGQHKTHNMGRAQQYVLFYWGNDILCFAYPKFFSIYLCGVCLELSIYALIEFINVIPVDLK